MKESTPGLNNYIGITITLDGSFMKKKKEKIVRWFLPIINQTVHINWEAENLPEI